MEQRYGNRYCRAGSRRKNLVSGECKYWQEPVGANIHTLQKMLGISRHHAYKRITSGRIKARKVGKSHKIPKVYVIDSLLQNEEADTLVQTKSA